MAEKSQKISEISKKAVFYPLTRQKKAVIILIPLRGLCFCVLFLRQREVPNWRCRKMRTKITLVCSECKQRNYDTVKNKKNDPDRLELKKFCKFCRKHTLHKESK